jgi:hypothetical protein
VHLHHWVPQQRVKARHKTVVAEHRRGGPKPWSLSEALNDPRNLSPLCFRCHGQFEQKKLRLEPPASALEFGRDFGLEWSLEADERKKVENMAGYTAEDAGALE